MDNGSTVMAERERYALAHTTRPDAVVAAVRAETESTMAAPQMAGGEVEVRVLEALVVASGARRVLEIGTFTGVTSLTLAARLPEGGKLTTLEVDPEAAAVARRHFDGSPYGGRIELILGDARETLQRLDGPFDLVWIDAWKRDYPAYYDAVVPKLAPRGMLAADNVFLGGRVVDPAADDEDAAGMRAFADRVQADPRVHNTLLTIGDGVLLAWRAEG
jgi:caffeoyl-CoA O-methyltransferase